MEIKKQVLTKYGVFEVEFVLDAGIWVASADYNNGGAVTQADTFDDAYDDIISCY